MPDTHHVSISYESYQFVMIVTFLAAVFTAMLHIIGWIATTPFLLIGALIILSAYTAQGLYHGEKP